MKTPKPATALPPALRVVDSSNGQSAAMWVGDYVAAMFPTHNALAHELARRHDAYPRLLAERAELVAALRSALPFVRAAAAEEVDSGISAKDGHACGHEHRMMALLRELGESE